MATLSPWLTGKKLFLMSHAAESSEFSNKDRHPFVGRMSRSMVKSQAYGLVDLVQQIIRHASAKLLSCDDAYCMDCSFSARQRAMELGVKIEEEIVLSLQTFKNDYNGRYLWRLLSSTLGVDNQPKLSRVNSRSFIF